MTPDPRARETALELEEAFRFETFDHWVRTAQRMPWTLEHRSDGGSHPLEICADTKGRICRMGRDFQQARDDDAFPVIAYRLVRVQPSAAPPDLVALVREWQEVKARLISLNEDGGGSDPDAFGAECDRYDAANAALAAYPLPPAHAETL